MLEDSQILPPSKAYCLVLNSLAVDEYAPYDIGI